MLILILAWIIVPLVLPLVELEVRLENTAKPRQTQAERPHGTGNWTLSAI